MNLKQQFKESAYSSKDTFLKCEDMVNGGVYAITFNPEHQPDLDAPRSVLDWWGEQKDHLSLKAASVRLFCEVSKTGRFHFHGFIKILNRVCFCIYDTKKLSRWGSVCIKQIGLPDQDPFDQYAEWYDYCLKCQPDMQDFLSKEMFSVLAKHEISDDWIVLRT